VISVAADRREKENLHDGTRCQQYNLFPDSAAFLLANRMDFIQYDSKNNTLARPSQKRNARERFDAWCPRSCQRGRKKHDGQHLRNSYQDLAVLGVMDSVIASMNSPTTPLISTSAVEPKVVWKNLLTSIHFLAESCRDFRCNLSDESLRRGHIYQYAIIRCTQEPFHGIIRNECFARTSRSYNRT
jgi:hypothetical protein